MHCNQCTTDQLQRTKSKEKKTANKQQKQETGCDLNTERHQLKGKLYNTIDLLTY